MWTFFTTVNEQIEKRRFEKGGRETSYLNVSFNVDLNIGGILQCIHFWGWTLDNQHLEKINSWRHFTECSSPGN